MSTVMVSPCLIFSWQCLLLLYLKITVMFISTDTSVSNTLCSLRASFLWSCRILHLVRIFVLKFPCLIFLFVCKVNHYSCPYAGTGQMHGLLSMQFYFDLFLGVVACLFLKIWWGLQSLTAEEFFNRCYVPSWIFLSFHYYSMKARHLIHNQGSESGVGCTFFVFKETVHNWIWSWHC